MAVTLKVDGVTLDQLWNVNISDIKDRCFKAWADNSQRKKVYWDDYCAINLSDILIKSGFKLPNKKTSPYKQCHSHRDVSGPNGFHFLLAQQMASWLDTKPIVGLPDKQTASGQEFENKFNNKQGIIFFKDYWREENQDFESRSGDHIDLWKKGRLPSSSSFGREISEFFGLVSELEDSKEVWLWELP